MTGALRWGRLLLIAPLLAIAPPAVADEERANLHQWGIGVQLGAGAANIGRSIEGPSAAIVARARLTDRILVEPHVDVFVGNVLLPRVRRQLAVPLVIERRIVEKLVVQAGAGPMIAQWTRLATITHDDWTTTPGAELFVALGARVQEHVELRLQLRGDLGLLFEQQVLLVPMGGLAFTAMFTL